MCRMGSVFEPSERKIFAAGRYAATSCGRIGTNGASGSATHEKGPFWGGFGQAERAAEPPRGTGIGGGNPSEPPCEPHPSGGGAACGAPLASARFQPSGAPKRFWRLVTSPRQRLRADTGGIIYLHNIDRTPSLAVYYSHLVRVAYGTEEKQCTSTSRGFHPRGNSSFPKRSANRWASARARNWALHQKRGQGCS